MTNAGRDGKQLAGRSTKPSVIAIDGPVACGKTAVGRLLAQRLGYKFLDTGAMYRAITWVAVEAGVDLGSAKDLAELAREREMEVVFDDEGEARILLDQRDATPHLRRYDVEASVSQVSLVPGVRDVLVAHQRRLAQGERMVMAGRDIGTVVLPEAPVKVFLTAPVEERARRRHEELERMGKGMEYRQVLEDTVRRDRLDTERPIAPLRPAEDASEVKTDGLSVEQVVEHVVAMVEST